MSMSTGMQAVFSQERSERIGNESLVRGLVELEKYEDALTGDRVSRTEGRTDDSANETHSYVNPQAGPGSGVAGCC